MTAIGDGPTIGGVWVGLDLGTSGVKAIAVTPAGRTVARGQAGYPTARTAAGASEQQPADWFTAIGAAVRSLLAEVPARHWRGIGLSAMLPTLVTLDAERTPLGSAVTWEDARGETAGTQLRERGGAQRIYAETGQWLDGRYLLPMYVALAAREHARERVTHTLAGAKDVLFDWLTGELATDPSTAAGYGAYRVRAGSWDETLLGELGAALDGAAPKLPPVLPASTVRPLRPAAATQLGLPAGLPVCLGAADSVLGALGIGVERSGAVAYLGGTSTVIIALSERFVPDPDHRYLLTPTALDGLYGIEMDLLCTGSAIRWLAGLIGCPSEAAMMELAAGVPAIDAPTFLPYLGPGEQGALWDASAVGAINGLHLQQTPADLARGLLNGVLLESRRCVAALRSAGIAADELHVSGGSASDPRFQQDLADCTGCRVIPALAETDQSALGAALLLARSVADPTAIATPAAAAADDGLSPSPRVAAPDAARAAVWQELWQRHERFRNQLKLDPDVIQLKETR